MTVPTLVEQANRSTGTATITVSQNGHGDCLTVGEALTLAEETRRLRRDARLPITILIHPGTYRERVTITLPYVTLEGVDAESTVIALGLGARMPADDGMPLGTFRTYTMLVDADHVTLRDLSIVNDAGDGREVGQAVALYADGDALLVEDCRLLGHQDTLFTGPLPPKELQPGGFIGPKQFAPRRVGRQRYRRCLIAGDVDFIFGGATALFEDCEIRSLDRGEEVNGYVTAASTPEGRTYGYVFRGCRFTSDGCAPGSVYLGRPWRDFARVALVDCELGEHIRPEGWWDWNKPHARVESRFSGMELHGPGFHPGSWPDWTLPDDPAGPSWYSSRHVLGVSEEESESREDEAGKTESGHGLA
ncbi:pectinesterase family protein [Bifidobacterium vansinderenii]|uniref:Pectinesterase n=1 Tax=Bifidobacterium vansinderenii TaxID=1984871 RepID=A0A229VW56_9BIFI|nr:pectinesterase family protein [Bifidobacterium vansinderenii]OXM99842.1 Pectinesterase A precursor [Bifidobacterium vansinderenii]